MRLTIENLPYIPEYCIENRIPPIRIPEIKDNIWPGTYASAIFDWFLSNPSANSIAEKLTQAKMPSPRQINNALKDFFSLSEAEQYHTPYIHIDNPKTWGGTSVRKIIKNPFYTGVGILNRFKNTNPYKENPRDKWRLIENAHPHLVSIHQFRQVQEKLKEVGRKRIKIEN